MRQFALPILVGLTLFNLQIFAQTATPTEGCASLPVSFNGEGRSYDWVFGNGSTASDTETPSIVYQNAGAYAVEVYEVGTSTLVTTIDITVYEAPSIAINASTVEGCVPLAVDFDYTLSSNVVAYDRATWVFGDGETDGASSNTISHLYDRSGDFNVAIELETTVSGCAITRTITDFVTVHDAPAIAFEIDPVSSCSAPADISITNNTTDLTAVNYLWDFDDGTTSTDVNPSHTYSTEETFNLKLTATNAEGCVSQDSTYYTVGTPVAVIDVPDTVCLDVGVTLAELTGGNATWRFNGTGIYTRNNDGDLEPITSTNSESVEVFFKSPGLQEIELELRTSGCGDDVITKDVFVQELTINPFLDQEYSCENPVTVTFDVGTDARQATYQWLFSDGSSSNDQQTTFTYYDESDTVEYGINSINIDTTYIIVTQPATSTRGVCYDTTLIDFEHYPVNAKVETLNGFTGGCEGTTLNFADSINISTLDVVDEWYWYLRDVTSNTYTTLDNGTGTVDPLSNTFTVSGDYEIYLDITTATGCRDTSYAMPVTIGAELTGADIDFDTYNIDGVTPQTSFCRGDSIIFSVTNSDQRITSFHFYADGNRLFHQPTDTTVSWAMGYELGPQDVTLQVDYDGCVSELTKNNYISVNGAVAEIVYGTDCSDPYSYNFESTSISFPSATPTLSWDFGDGNTGSAANEANDYSLAGSGDYWVVLEAEDAASGCDVHRDFVEVTPRRPIADLMLNNTIACGGNELVLDASASSDAKGCRGLTFRFPTYEDIQRPITTYDTDTLAITIPDYSRVDTTAHFFQLIVTDDNGCRDTVNSDTLSTSYIRVSAEVDTAVTCQPIELTFSDSTVSATPLLDWQWVIWSGDQTLADTVSGDDTYDTISYTFNQEPVGIDSFFVALEVTAADGCVGGVGDTLFILPYYRLSSRLRTGDNSALCEGDTASFRGRDNSGLGLTFAWDFGNGVTDTTYDANTYTEVAYDSGALYSVNMFFFQEKTGCVDTLSTNVEVQSGPDVGFMTNLDTLDVICAPSFLTFSDTSRAVSGSVSSVEWDFDNGETGSSSTYTSSFQKGTYNVSLTASTSNGCSNTVVKPVTLVGPEGTILVGDTLVCPGDVVAFDIQDKIDVDSVVWIFGDGEADSSNREIINHAYNNVPPSYQVTASLLLYSADGCEQASFENISFHRVVAGFEFIDSVGVADSLFCVDEIFATADSSLNADVISWLIDDDTVGTSDSYSSSYLDGGIYPITQVVLNTTEGCIDSVTRYVDVHDLPSIGFESSVDAVPFICAPEAIDFTDSSRTTSGTIVDWFWDFDNGVTRNTRLESVTFDKGTYNISLTATTAIGCTNTSSRSITLTAPEGSILADTLVCQGEDVLFDIAGKVDVDSVVWFFGDGTADSMNQHTITHQYSASSADPLTAALFIYSVEGCVDSSFQDISFQQLEAGFQFVDSLGTIDSVFCMDEVFATTDQSLNADAFSWFLGGTEVSNNMNYAAFLSESGAYPITQVVQNTAEGCVDSLTRTITIDGAFSTLLSLADDSLCLGEDLILTNLNFSESSSYSLQPDVFTDRGNGLYTSRPDGSFTFMMTEVNEYGCRYSTDTSVVVIQPYAYMDWDTTIQEGKTARLPVMLDSLFTFTLTPEEGLSCLNCDYPRVSPIADVSYNLNIKDIFGCFDDNYTLTVFVIPPSFISMPTNFTPNGDGVNDEVFVKGWLLSELLEFKIFNRWGEEVFSTTDLEKGWDGTFNGISQPADAYVYKIRAIGVDGVTVFKEGYLNLLR